MTDLRALVRMVRFAAVRMSAIFWMFAAIWFFSQTVQATQTDIPGPAGSSFGSSVTVLPNGNIVVTAPFYDIPLGAADVGAVYLYDGASLALISTLTGSTAGDQVGSQGITVLANGNYVVKSPLWDNTLPAAAQAGAATWCSAVTGCSGVVSDLNSLVGATLGDAVGVAVTVLNNGNYVVRSSDWSNTAPFVSRVGAVTWGNGTTGVSGLVSSANSLIGSTSNDAVGSHGVTALTNGNYVVLSQAWNNPSPAIADVGAVTWGNGTTGTIGTVSSANSLIGSTATDIIGFDGVTALTNGNYVVRSQFWDSTLPDVGAVTWGNGATGTSGVVTTSNSLVGGTPSDRVGSGGFTVLTNGNYVVSSVNWDRTSPSVANVGAATWGNGATGGTVGLVSESNSVIGSTAGDQISETGVFALANGNYVVCSQLYSNPANPALFPNIGAATWGNGAIGTSGAVSAGNSLIGFTLQNRVCSGGVTALTNGNYVVRSPEWDTPPPTVSNVGAATWGNGTTGTSGVVSAANSLVGSTEPDRIGSAGIIALNNGNYVVSSPSWDASFALSNLGAATFGNGTTGISGAVSSSNSLVGSTAGDFVGNNGSAALTNGNYVVISPFVDSPSSDGGMVTWGNGITGISGAVSQANSLYGTGPTSQIGIDGVVVLTNGNYVVRSPNWRGPGPILGEATWGNGLTGTTGVVSQTNSLVGDTADDFVSSNGITAFSNGNYVVSSPLWDNPSTSVVNAGAFTFGSGASGTSGLITDGATGGNSVVGTVTTGLGPSTFDPTRNRLIVGRPTTNTVSLLSFTTTAIADGDVGNAANWSNGAPDGLVTGIIPSGRTMTISSVMNIGQLRVECGGDLTGGGSAAYVVGSVRRDFCAAAGATFSYPIGDPSNYSPLTASNVSGTGSLTASVTDTFMPGLTATTEALSRHWTLDGAGITTDLTFQYVDADVNGSELSYRAFKRFGTLPPLQMTSSVNTALNTIAVPGVSSFSQWGAGMALIPTAAGVAVSGRVMTADGRGVRGAIVTMTDRTGALRTALSSSFGYYRFDDVRAGESYVLGVSSKRYQFKPRVLTITDELTDIDFVGHDTGRSIVL